MPSRLSWAATLAVVCASNAGLPPCRAPAGARFPPSQRAFFFVGLRPPSALPLHLLAGQFLPPLGQGVRVQSEQAGDAAVAPAAQFERFQASIQAALLFVEQAIQEDDPGLHRLGETAAFAVACRKRCKQAG